MPALSLKNMDVARHYFVGVGRFASFNNQASFESS
jgi:hypothetical protein